LAVWPPPGRVGSLTSGLPVVDNGMTRASCFLRFGVVA